MRKKKKKRSAQWVQEQIRNTNFKESFQEKDNNSLLTGKNQQNLKNIREEQFIKSIKT